tara:strand:+ start:136 stop:558 length:423 start_codon:yes stop_codon:yes gene_type:complete
MKIKGIMTNLHKGGCRCGAARYEIDLTNANTLACHCRDCQKHMGTPFSVFTVVPKSQFKWISKPSNSVTLSTKASRLFCGNCGTCLKWEGVQAPHEAEINAMSLDDPSIVQVNQEIFVKSRLSWIKPLDSIPQFEESSNY